MRTWPSRRCLDFDGVTAAQQGQLISIAVIAVAIAFGLQRRMRPQPVRGQRILITGVIVAILLLVGLVGSGRRIISDPLAIALIPVFVAGGVALGAVLVRTMNFWTDQQTGQLWMSGGWLFAAVILVTLALRFGYRYVVFGNALATGSAGSRGFWGDLSADLILLSLGLWGARSFLLYQRSRQHTSAASG